MRSRLAYSPKTALVRLDVLWRMLNLQVWLVSSLPNLPNETAVRHEAAVNDTL